MDCKAPEVQIAEAPAKKIVLIAAAVEAGVQKERFTGMWHWDCYRQAIAAGHPDAVIVEGYMTQDGQFLSKSEESQLHYDGLTIQDIRGRRG